MGAIGLKEINIFGVYLYVYKYVLLPFFASNKCLLPGRGEVYIFESILEVDFEFNFWEVENILCFLVIFSSSLLSKCWHQLDICLESPGAMESLSGQETSKESASQGMS